MSDKNNNVSKKCFLYALVASIQCSEMDVMINSTDDSTSSSIKPHWFICFRIFMFILQLGVKSRF